MISQFRFLFTFIFLSFVNVFIAMVNQLFLAK